MTQDPSALDELLKDDDPAVYGEAELVKAVLLVPLLLTRVWPIVPRLVTDLCHQTCRGRCR